MASEAAYSTGNEERSLIVEAMSLLVQRQRQTETSVIDRARRAEERAAEAERRSALLESRLAGIEAHLALLTREVEAVRGDTQVDVRVASLRQQVEVLKTAPADEAIPAPVVASPPPAAPQPVVPQPVVSHAVAPPPVAPQPVAPQPVAPAHTPAPHAHPRAVPVAARSNDFWLLLGANNQDRLSVALIGGGAVAVLFALLTQVRV